MLEMWEQVKLLGHMGKVSLKGVVNEELLDIDRNADLLSLCDKVPLSYKRVVLIYVQHIEEEGVAVNEDCEEVVVALNEDSENIGPISDENRASTEGSGPLNNEKEGRPFTEHHGLACRVEDWVSSDDDGPLNNEGSKADIGDTDMEDSEDSEDSEEEDKEEDPDFVDSAYEQSENECELLRNDDKAFENYVDQLVVVEDPNAPVDEDRESTDIAKSDVESLDNSSDDEDDGNQKKRKKKFSKFQEFRPEIDMHNLVFKLGLRFATTDLFRKAIRNYSIVNRRMIKFKCNDLDRVRAVCAGNCKWHDCGTVDHNFHANSTWLAQRYATQLSRKHNWDMGNFKQQVREDLSMIASKSQIYRARQKATSISEGTYEKQYELLWDYVAELKITNVGSTVIMKCELEGERPRFQKIYICLAAVKQRFFQGCRPVIGFDACHIKGHHPGQLLSAVGVDPNNGMYPIAYAVAEVENYETWSWFCQLLAKDLGIENSSGYVFITDKQKGLIDAVHDHFPNAEHRHCLKHLEANFLLTGHR
ncbi:unnamed protein product [Prunus armeniaca]